MIFENKLFICLVYNEMKKIFWLKMTICVEYLLYVHMYLKK